MPEASQEIIDQDNNQEPSKPRKKKFARNREKPQGGLPEFQDGSPLLCDSWNIPNKRRLQIAFVGIAFLLPFLTLSLVYPEWTGHVGTRLSLGLFSLLGQAALMIPFLTLYIVLSCSGFRALRKTRYLFSLPLFLSLLLLTERWFQSGGWLGGLLDKATVAALGPGGAWLLTGTLLALSIAAFFPKAKHELLHSFSLLSEHFREAKLGVRNKLSKVKESSQKDVESPDPMGDENSPSTQVGDIPQEERVVFFAADENKQDQRGTPTNSPVPVEAPLNHLTPPSPPPAPKAKDAGPTTDSLDLSEPTAIDQRALLNTDRRPESRNRVETPVIENPNVLRFAAPEEIEDSLEINRPKLTNSDEAEAAVPRARTFELPPLVLLDEIPYAERSTPTEDKSQALLDALEAFGVKAKLLQIVRGPTVTRYELQPARGVKVSKFTSLTNDIALALASTAVRIEAPIPGKSAIGIEIPNKHTDLVVLKDIIRDSIFTESKGLTVALGKDLSGRPVVTDLQKMPHLLVAGTTGSGKSVCVNGLIISLLYRFTPDQLQLMMVDPKQVELSVYQDIPHLVGFSESDKGEIIVDPKKAAQALHQVVGLMEERYKLFAENKVRNLAEYNKKFEDEQMPWFVVIIDELADLMMVASKSVETSICRIAQKARAAGIHLVLATQRPSADVITGLIKVNIPSRAAFAVSSQVDSRVILDSGGAEQLLGKGDMLFLPVDASDPKRLQGSYVGNEEISRVVEFWKGQGLPDNRIEFEFEADILAEDDDKDSGDSDDALIDEALRVTLNRKQASASMLQTELKVGYARARRLLIAMEKKGWVGPPEGSKPRKILYTGPPPDDA